LKQSWPCAEPISDPSRKNYPPGWGFFYEDIGLPPCSKYSNSLKKISRGRSCRCCRPLANVYWKNHPRFCPWFSSSVSSKGRDIAQARSKALTHKHKNRASPVVPVDFPRVATGPGDRCGALLFEFHGKKVCSDSLPLKTRPKYLRRIARAAKTFPQARAPQIVFGRHCDVKSPKPNLDFVGGRPPRRRRPNEDVAQGLCRFRVGPAGKTA